MEIIQEEEKYKDDGLVSIVANLAKSVNDGVNVDEGNIVDWVKCEGAQGIVSEEEEMQR